MGRAEVAPVAKCHLCHRVDNTVRYCSDCEHWFCEVCRVRWLSRGVAFVQSLITWHAPGVCCGPLSGLTLTELDDMMDEQPYPLWVRPFVWLAVKVRAVVGRVL